MDAQPFIWATRQRLTACVLGKVAADISASHPSQVHLASNWKTGAHTSPIENMSRRGGNADGSRRVAAPVQVLPFSLSLFKLLRSTP